jgi:hypothetical protein
LRGELIVLSDSGTIPGTILTYTAETDRVLVSCVFNGGSQNLSLNPGGYDPGQLGSSIDGQVNELIAFDPSTTLGQIQLSYEMRAGEQIFYDSRGGGWVQLFFQLTPIPAVEPL